MPFQAVTLFTWSCISALGNILCLYQVSKAAKPRSPITGDCPYQSHLPENPAPTSLVGTRLGCPVGVALGHELEAEGVSFGVFCLSEQSPIHPGIQVCKLHEVAHPFSHTPQA